LLDECNICGNYTINQPCHECLVKERDKYKEQVNANTVFLISERDKYKKLYEMAISTCDRCKENCAIRTFGKKK